MDSSHGEINTIGFNNKGKKYDVLNKKSTNVTKIKIRIFPV